MSEFAQNVSLSGLETDLNGNQNIDFHANNIPLTVALPSLHQEGLIIRPAVQQYYGNFNPLVLNNNTFKKIETEAKKDYMNRDILPKDPNLSVTYGSTSDDKDKAIGGYDLTGDSSKWDWTPHYKIEFDHVEDYAGKNTDGSNKWILAEDGEKALRETLSAKDSGGYFDTYSATIVESAGKGINHPTNLKLKFEDKDGMVGSTTSTIELFDNLSNGVGYDTFKINIDRPIGQSDYSATGTLNNYLPNYSVLPNTMMTNVYKDIGALGTITSSSGN